MLRHDPGQRIFQLAPAAPHRQQPQSELKFVGDHCREPEVIPGVQKRHDLGIGRALCQFRHDIRVEQEPPQSLIPLVGLERDLSLRLVLPVG